MKSNAKDPLPLCEHLQFNWYANQINQFTNLDEYIGLIYEKYLRRILIKLGEEIIESGYLNEIPLETIFTQIEQKIFFLTENKSRRHLISIEEGLQQLLEEIEYKLRKNSVGCS